MVIQEHELLWIDPSQTNEDDLSVSRTDAVVTSTDWTAETIFGQLKRGNIELSPRFQRREAWTDRRKSAFIESLFLGLPVPQIVLAERTDKKGSYIVIDGKQRLLAIRRFGVTDEDDEFTPLRLSGLKIRADLNDNTWAEIKDEPEFQGDIAAYENQTIRTVVVRNWPDDSFLYLIFLRLNTGSVPLSPQELRQALHPGPFTDFMETYSAESVSLQLALGLVAPDFRMRDVEILVRYVAFAERIKDYRGNLKEFLDRTAELLNENWIEKQSHIFELAQRCDEAINATVEIFGENAFHIWGTDGYESRFNRAVFDIMTYYFSDPKIAQAAIEKRAQIIGAYEQLCDENDDFMNSLQTTTKSIDATFTRLSAWGEILRSTLGTPVEIPTPGGS